MPCEIEYLPVLIVLLALSIAAFAVTPQFWENFSQEDLLKGSFKQLSLSSDGKLFFAPAYDLVYDTGQAYIFSMVRDKAGNLYVGTGDEGKVFKIDPQGKGSLYFQSKELNVFALALDSSDTLYVGHLSGRKGLQSYECEPVDGVLQSGKQIYLDHDF